MKEYHSAKTDARSTKKAIWHHMMLQKIKNIDTTAEIK